MQSICLLENIIQEYAWGSCTAIPRLLGRTPDPGKPQAELWMGVHPKAPSTVICGERSQTLSELIRRYPAEVLGPTVAAKFENQLPYLFKILAAARPLSLSGTSLKGTGTRGV